MEQDRYRPYVSMLLRVLPHIVVKGQFALKGGTAINLFVRDMPRLSIDIDLTYVPIENRQTSLKKMGRLLKESAQKIKRLFPDMEIHFLKESYKLFLRYQQAQVKIEPNQILRGTLFPCEERELVPSAQNLFGMFVAVDTLSFPDLYGGKLCAALDRQHPRDWFDVKILLDNEGVTKEVQKAFVVYLAGHDRPMAELLNPTLHDFSQVFKNEFVAMTRTKVTYEDLIRTRNELVTTLQNNLTTEERQFLLSIKQGEPQWGLMEMPVIEKLPAIQWKLKNVRQMDKMKQRKAAQKLRAVLKL